MQVSIEDVVRLNRFQPVSNEHSLDLFNSITEGWIGGVEMRREDLAKLLYSLLAVSLSTQHLLEGQQWHCDSGWTIVLQQEI